MIYNIEILQINVSFLSFNFYGICNLVDNFCYRTGTSRFSLRNLLRFQDNSTTVTPQVHTSNIPYRFTVWSILGAGYFFRHFPHDCHYRYEHRDTVVTTRIQ